MNADSKTFLFDANEIKKITTKIIPSTLEELDAAVAKQKDKENVQINSKTFEVLKKEYGEFEISRPLKIKQSG